MVKKPSVRDSSRLAFGLGVLILFALTYGYLVMATFADYRPQEHMPAWEGAQWITTNTAASGYFHKRLLLPSVPRKAYLVVAGTDEVTVYINNYTAGSSRFFGVKTSMILDITKYMRRGDNLIAVKVDNQARGALPALAARLVMSLPDGSQRVLVTDRTWQATGREEYQQLRQVPWTALEFVDLDWPFASLTDACDTRPTRPLRVPEEVFRSFPKGHWIWQSENPNAATFIRDFEVIGSRISDAWFGVSVDGQYSLTVNGVLLSSQKGSKKTMEVFDIGPYVRLGRNRLLLDVESDTLNNPQPLLATSGTVTTDVGVTDLEADSRWRVLKESGLSDAVSDTGPVVVLSGFEGDIRDAHLTLVFTEVAVPAVKLLQDIKRWLAVAAVIFLVASLSFAPFHWVTRRHSSLTLPASLETYSFPLLGGAVVSGALLLVRYDPRIDFYLPFQPFVPLLIASAVIGFEGLILIEKVVRR